MNLIANEQCAEEGACRQIAKTDFIDECGPIRDPLLCHGRGDVTAKVDQLNPEKTFCGCKSCTTDAWITMAEDFSCGARISYLTDFEGKTEQEACRKVGGVEFPALCGPCNPDTCEKVDPQKLTEMHDSGAKVPKDQPQSPAYDAIPLTPKMPLHCFPAYNDRRRCENVWGKCSLEVKESENACGPSDNIFSRPTVHVSNDELTLQFRKIGNQWAGSEVRLLLPQEEMPFHYGECSFSVKSVSVIDIMSGATVDTVLPVSIVLGLFSYDATEDYSIHENYNHEVDVEISRWNIDDLADVQCLVQPPGNPHKCRFFSGEGGTYRQAPNTYKFDWKPAEIDWSSSAGGGGHSFTYKTQDALDAGQPDYTQCMPADVEIRMNLWNLFGSSTTPEGMRDSYVVEVVIDNFQFTPSGLTGLQEGGVCSKDCQCDSSLRCPGNRCVPSGSSSSGATSTIGENFGSGMKPFPQGTPNENSTDVADATPEVPTNPEAAESDGGGMSRLGKSLLTMFVLLFCALAGAIIIKNSQDASNEGKMSRIIKFRDSNPKKKVVVECWETDVEESTSFEMKVKDVVHESSIVSWIGRGNQG